MAKKIVLIILFILPLVVYLFFATGVNNFTTLPTITKSIPEVSFGTATRSNIRLKDHITILGFLGNDISKVKGNLFNLNQKIYDKCKDFKDFQVVYLAQKGTEAQVKKALEPLERISDLSRWHFIYTTPDTLAAFHKKLNLIEVLNPIAGTPQVYIVDKDLNVRGRRGKNKKGEQEYKEGYNTISAADLHNDMGDDVKVILAEYRLALKRNNKRKI